MVEASTSLEVMKSEKRVAFVIGNAQYDFGNISKSTLSSRNMRDFLKEQNFEVIYLENAQKGDIVKSYRKFRNSIGRGDVVLIYFSGYVLSKNSINYLLPISSKIEKTNQLRERAVDLDFLITKASSSSPRMSIVVLDTYEISGLQGISTKDSEIASLSQYKSTDSYVGSTKNSAKNNGKFTHEFIYTYSIKGVSNIQGSSKLLRFVTHNNSDIFYFGLPNKLEKDYDIAWKQVQAEDTLLAYQAYLLTYPSSPYTKKANRKLNVKQKQSEDFLDKRAENHKSSDIQKEIDRLKHEQAELKRLQKEANRRRDLEMRQEAVKAKAESDEIKRLKAENARILSAQKSVKTAVPKPSSVKFLEPDLVKISVGTFMMGSDAIKASLPLHKVQILKSFSIAKNEITNREYKLFLHATGKKYRKKKLLKELDTPLTYVSWKDAMEYVEWLSEVSGKHYRLPSEAEWEYAARAGTSSTFSWGESLTTAPLYAWMEKNAHGFVRTHSLLQSNKFGLYDMFGNVSEWCVDDYSDGYRNAPTDGSANKLEDAMKVVRGGSWKSSVDELKSAYRNSNIPTFKNDATGFRIVLDD